MYTKYYYLPNKFSNTSLIGLNSSHKIINIITLNKSLILLIHI